MLNIYDGVQKVTHLYGFALTKEKFEWADMEYLINLHGAEHLFYGGRPFTVAEACRKFKLAFDLSAQEAAKHRHSKRYISARGPQMAVRQHRSYSIRSDLFSWRYEAVRMRQGPLEGPQTTLLAFELLLEFQKRMPNATAISKHGHPTYIVSLLALVRSAIAEDEKHLAFDYFAMDLRCWNLHELLQTELHDVLGFLRESIGQDFSRQDQITLRMIPPIIFQCLETKSGPQSFKAARPALKVQRVIQTVAVEEGSVGLDLAEARVVIDEGKEY